MTSPPANLIGRGRTAELFAWDGHQALKLFYAGWPSSAAEAEARLAKQVHESGLRVPAVGGTMEVDGRPGILYELVEGPAMLDSLSARPWKIVAFANLLAELHAQMHMHQTPELPTQRKRMLEQIRSTTALTDQQKKSVIEILDKLPDGQALCHGDYHPGNVLLAKDGPVIIDWPLASHGNPVADVARTSLLLSLGAVPAETPGRWLLETGRSLFHYLYLRRYTQLRAITSHQVAAWKIPVIAARLGEGLEEEKDNLLAIITRALSS